MFRYYFSLLFITAFSFCFSQNTSTIEFKIKNLGVNVDGYFNSFSVTTKFNNEAILEKLSGKIKVASLKTGIESRDKHLLEDDYFNSNKYAFILFESTSIRKESETVYKVKGNLTIKGKTKQITIPVAVSKTSKNHVITSEFEINRRDFDVGGGSFIMSKTVKINVVQYQKL